MNIKILSLIFTSILFVGCASSPKIDNMELSKNPDVLNLEYPQNTAILPDVRDYFKSDGAEFKSRYFKVWHNDNPDTSASNAFWGLNYAKGNHFDSNGVRYSEEFYKNVIYNANKGAFGEISAPGITVKNTLLRNIPSDKPIFGDPSKPGEGVPFDYASNSALGLGYPLFISHYSVDKKWAFVENDGVWGWVKSENINELPKRATEIYERSNFITIIKDNAEIRNEYGKVIFRARMGTILPFEFQNGENLGGKYLTKNGVEPYFVSVNDARIWPATLEDKNVKIAASSILGQKYGWGGYDYLRDCSLLTKDFFANFGIWLPRNSKSQSKMGVSHNLKNMSNNEKLNFILRNAKPYRSILFMPGHIMLYVGQIQGQPAVLHNVWGLRRLDNGRAIIGKTAITSLEIGQYRQDIAQERLLISRIATLSNF